LFTAAGHSEVVCSQGKSASDKQMLVPLTIGVFKQASTSDEDVIQIDGREINQVTMFSQ
jgi:hypothetical protein